MSEQPIQQDPDEQARQELIDYDSGYSEDFIPEGHSFHEAYAAAKAKGILGGYRLGVEETAIENAQLKAHNKDLEEENSRAEEKALTDSKTGLLNARGLEEAYKKMQLRHEQHRRKNDPEAVPQAPTIIFLDLDKFKDVNESLGHGDADNLLNVIGQFIKASLREGDTVGRFGGDEFITLIEDISEEDSQIVAERIRTNIENIDSINDKPIRPTASIGIGEIDISKPFSEAIASSNEAMYKAKGKGRNQVVRLARS